MAPANLKLVEGDGSVERLCDVRVPDKFFKKMRLSPVIDELFGGLDAPGVLVGSSLLFTGSPGSGKSTACLQLADMFQAAGQRVLFNIGEENRYMVKLRADRLGARAQYRISQVEWSHELVDLVVRDGYTVLFQDSLQTLRDPDHRGHAGLLAATARLQKLSKDRDVTVVIVGQCTKGGTFAGPNEIAHSLDAHLHLSVEGDGRKLQFTKNRFGPSGLPFRVELTPTGMDFRPDDAAPPATGAGAVPAPGHRRGESKRQDVLAVAKERLLAGSMVSGYTYQDLGLECSGGFWRGMVARACDELRREGYGIGERRVNGRSHQFINLWKKG